MVLARAHAVHQQRFGGFQEHEVDFDGGVFEGGDAQDVAVFALEGGAGYDDARGGVGGGLLLGRGGEEGFDCFVAEQD